MAKLIKETGVNATGRNVALFDKTKKNTEYNYLVEVTQYNQYRQRMETTEYSKFFVELVDAENYYNSKIIV